MTTKICTKYGEEKILSKECTKCKKDKKISEFYKRNDTKDGLQYLCKECTSNRGKEYYKNNKEKVTERKKLWREDNKEKIRKTKKLYNDTHKEHNAEISKKWAKNNPDKLSLINKRKRNKRKRNFGYVPLNKEFPGSVGHHISKDLVIHIPEELHKSIPHRQDDLVSMEEINILAMEYV